MAAGGLEIYLRPVGKLVQKGIHPANFSRGPARHERPTHAGIDGDESIVLLVEVVGAEHLTEGAQVEASVGPLHDADVR